MIISFVVAVSENNAIGRDNSLLWHLPDDMKSFREITTGHCVISGRKSYESIPTKFRPLPNRTNIVITRQKNYSAPGAVVTGSLEEAIAEAGRRNETECFIIGGAEIYRQCLQLCSKIYLTKVHATFDADAFFPDLDMNEWKVIQRISHPKDVHHAFAFDYYELEKKKIK